MCVTKGALFWLHRYRVLLLLCCLFRKEKKSLLRGAVLPFSVWKEVFILFSFALFLVAAYGGHVYLYTKLLSIVFSFLSYFASSGLFHPPAVCCISYYSRCCIRQRSLICEAFCGVVADVTGPQKRWKITLPFNLLLYFFFLSCDHRITVSGARTPCSFSSDALLLCIYTLAFSNVKIVKRDRREIGCFGHFFRTKA